MPTYVFAMDLEQRVVSTRMMEVIADNESEAQSIAIELSDGADDWVERVRDDLDIQATLISTRS